MTDRPRRSDGPADDADPVSAGDDRTPTSDVTPDPGDRSTSVDDLLARHAGPDAGRRSRRDDRNDDTVALPAADLLANFASDRPVGDTGAGWHVGSGSAPAGFSGAAGPAAGPSTSPSTGYSRSSGQSSRAAGAGRTGAAAGASAKHATVLNAAPIPAAAARGERPHRHPFLNYGGHIVVAVISAFVLVVTGVYWNIRTTGDQDLKDNSVDIGSADNSMVTARPTTTDANGNVVPATYQAENFLLVGSDTRAGANNIDGSAAELEGGANTDSIMLLHISADRQHIYAVSLPRDMWAPNVECNSYDQTTNTYGSPAESNDLEKQHINSFYGVGGPKCLVDAVENLTQLNITHYIQIDFSGFQAMVDAIGGIIVNVCRPIIDETLGTVIPTAGEQGIGGATALSLARARKVQGDTESDLARIHRQQVLLSTILRKVKSAGVLLDPSMLGDFVTAFTQNTTTAGIDFNSLMTLAESIGDLDPSKVTFFTLPTVADPEDASDRGSMYIDKDTSAPLLDAIRNDQALPGLGTTAAETTPAATTGPTVATFTVAPDAVELQVVNVAGQSGVAGEAATALNELGFDIGDADLLKNDTTEPGVTVHYTAGNEAAALTVAAAVPGSTLVAEDGLGAAVELHLGESWQSTTFSAVTVGAEIPADLLAQVPAGSAGQVATATSSGTPDSTTTTEIQQVNAGDASCM